jgi:hypothetical protein
MFFYNKIGHLTEQYITLHYSVPTHLYFSKTSTKIQNRDEAKVELSREKRENWVSEK